MSEGLLSDESYLDEKGDPFGDVVLVRLGPDERRYRGGVMY